MNRNVLVTIILLIVTLILLIITVLASNKKVTRIISGESKVPTFSIDVNFDEFPKKINLENKFDCNANDVNNLKECKIDDNTTLYGCKELTVKCHHFYKDTPVFNKGRKYIIPHNKTPNDGYALAIPIITDACNINHGELTLVTTGVNSKEYMMICSCTNPGYIGNEDLMGDCSTVFICDGKVDDMSKKLNEIHCVCNARQIHSRYEDGSPFCKDMTVDEANLHFDDWSRFIHWNSDRLLKTNNFNVNIRQNLNTSVLLDPCRNSIHDTRVEIKNAHYNPVFGECSFFDYGYPVECNLLEEKNKPIATESKKDEKEKKKNLIISNAHISCGLATGLYISLRFTDNIAGRNVIYRKISSIFVDGIPFHDEYKEKKILLVNPYGTTLGKNRPISITPRNKDHHDPSSNFGFIPGAVHYGSSFVGPKCEKSSWPFHYNCFFGEHFGVMRNNLPFPFRMPSPPEFYWNTEYWDEVESLIPDGVFSSTATGILFLNSDLHKIRETKIYGLIFSCDLSPHFKEITNGVLVYDDEDDYQSHRDSMIGSID